MVGASAHPLVSAMALVVSMGYLIRLGLFVAVVPLLAVRFVRVDGPWCLA